MRSLSHLALCLTLAACGGGDTGLREVSSQPGRASQVSFLNVPGAATVATDVAITVKVADAKGLAVPSQLVNFVVASGGGHVFAGSAITTALGEAKDVWTLGTRSGAQRLEARAVDQATGTPIVLGAVDIVAQPGPATGASFYSGTIISEAADLWIEKKPRDAGEMMAAYDQYVNPVESPVFSVTAADPRWTVNGSVVTAPSGGLSTTLTYKVGTKSYTQKVRSEPDLNAANLVASFACALPDGGGTATATLTVDSVRYRNETQKWRNRQYELGVIFASGSQQMPDGTTMPMKREIELVNQNRDTLRYSVYTKGPPPGMLPDSATQQYPGGIGTQRFVAMRTAVSPLTYVGGSWCADLHAAAPLTLTAKQ